MRDRRIRLIDIRRFVAATLLGPGGFVFTAGAGQAGGETGVTALRGSYIEREDVTLIVLDVDVRDKNGRPVRGLAREDFSLHLDHRSWPICSVDDLCRIGSTLERSSRGEEPAWQGEHPGRESLVSDSDHPDFAQQDPVRYVLYFDFSQLQQAGRLRALRAARSWVEEVKKPDD